MLNEEFLQALDVDIIERFKRAVELGKWPDGKALSSEQRETCMQAIIIFEHRHLNEDERTGYIPPKEDPCGPKDDIEEIKWT
ncbi:YeaC family protein [Agaribacterium sp. ZY112]|uniref:YeaC family protein n=1 Tax=Agaribacterium sp. ZY112 TaxID=3233574 RepID=UPI00352548EF